MRTAGAIALLLALLTAACAASSGSSAVAPPRLSAAPGTIEPGVVWRTRLTAPGGGTRLVLTASDGTRTLRFVAARRSRGVYGANLSFPHTRTWRLATVVGGRRHALRTVRVTLEVAEAYKVVVDRDGTLLVADANHGSGRVVRIDAATSRRSVAVRPGGRVYSVALGPDGSSTSSRRTASGGSRRTAAARSSPGAAPPARAATAGRRVPRDSATRSPSRSRPVGCTSRSRRPRAFASSTSRAARSGRSRRASTSRSG